MTCVYVAFSCLKAGSAYETSELGEESNGMVVFKTSLPLQIWRKSSIRLVHATTGNVLTQRGRARCINPDYLPDSRPIMCPSCAQSFC